MFKALLCHPVKDDTKDVWKTGAASNCLAWRSAAGLPRSVPSQGLQPWRNLPLRRPPLKQPCVYRRARALSRAMEGSDLSQTLPGQGSSSSCWRTFQVERMTGSRACGSNVSESFLRRVDLNARLN